MYRWNKNKQTILIPGSENINKDNQTNMYNHRQEVVQSPRNESTTTNHELISASAPVINNHVQESIPIDNDERESWRQNFSELKQEIQNLRQIILQQNNNQSTSSMKNNN